MSEAYNCAASSPERGRGNPALAIKERPILFSGPMVRALLAGRKTQTRRAVKIDVPADADEAFFWSGEQFKAQGCKNVAETGLWARAHGHEGYLRHLGSCPYGAPGDVLWVREAFSGPWDYRDVPPRHWPADLPIWYWADGNIAEFDATKPKPSIHMPRGASRLSLKITDIRVERLRDITDADATSEGVFEPSLGDLFVIDHGNPGKLPREHAPPLVLWQFLWKSINGDASWDANPWVWAVSFEVVTPDGVGRDPRPHPVGSETTVCQRILSSDAQSVRPDGGGG